MNTALNEEQILLDASMLLMDPERVRWTRPLLTVLFSLALARIYAPRSPFYEEGAARRLMEDVIRMATSLFTNEPLKT